MMRKFRRSQKNASEQSLPQSQHHIRDPSSVVDGPIKVITATQAFQPTAQQKSTGLIPFQEGDYFHVIGHEDHKHFYEVDGLKGVRGLVPRVFFEDVGNKDERQRARLEPLGHTGANGTGDNRDQDSQQAHDSGFADGEGTGNYNQSARESVGGSEAAEAARKKSMSSSRNGRAGTLIYGVVSFDFKAERPDELEARAGEKIMVIAQSNPEWFVAKPIERLGGPGLIPVAFVSLRYTNDQSEVVDPVEAIRAAGVPRVEEWKSRAAWYKNNSVPLGRLGSQVQGSQQSLTDSVARLSVGTGASRKSGDTYRDNQHRSSRHSQIPIHNTSNQRFTPLSGNATGLMRDSESGEYFFRIEVRTLEGSSWGLKRSYKQFFDLQNQFFHRFPVESGQRNAADRTIPVIPGPLPTITHDISRQRLPYLAQYVRTVLQLPGYISKTDPCRTFFSPYGEDELIDDLAADFGVDSSDGSQGMVGQQAHPPGNPYPQDQNNASYASFQSINSSNGATYANGSPQRRQPPAQSQHQQPPSQIQQQPPYRSDSPYAPDGPGHYRAPSNMHPPNGTSSNASTNGTTIPPPIARTDTALTQNSVASASAIKIKVFLAENIIMLRLPPSFTYTDLVSKIHERWRLEPDVVKSGTENAEFSIDFRSEKQGQFFRMTSQADLETARATEEKLIVRVRTRVGDEG